VRNPLAEPQQTSSPTLPWTANCPTQEQNKMHKRAKQTICHRMLVTPLHPQVLDLLTLPPMLRLLTPHPRNPNNNCDYLHSLPV